VGAGGRNDPVQPKKKKDIYTALNIEPGTHRGLV
jgi:hypothetical protein